MKTYVKIRECCGWEGEDWYFFLIEQGNTLFIEKLKQTIAKFEDMQGSDSYLEVLEEGIPENEIDILIKHNPESGYMSMFNKCDKKISDSILKKAKDEYKFQQIY